jgi:hypothetical protein
LVPGHKAGPTKAEAISGNKFSSLGILRISYDSFDKQIYFSNSSEIQISEVNLTG